MKTSNDVYSSDCRKSVYEIELRRSVNIVKLFIYFNVHSYCHVCHIVAI